MAPVCSDSFCLWEGWGGYDIRRMRQGRPMEFRTLGPLPLSWESLRSVTMLYAMAPVWGADFRLLEMEVEGGADIQRVQRVLVAQASTAGGLLCTDDVLVVVYPMPRQRCR